MSKTVAALIAVALVLGCAWFTLTDRLTGITTKDWPPFSSVKFSPDDKTPKRDVPYFMAGPGAKPCLRRLAQPVDTAQWGDEWKRKFPPVKNRYSTDKNPYKSLTEDGVLYDWDYHNGEWRVVPIDKSILYNQRWWKVQEGLMLNVEPCFQPPSGIGARGTYA